MRADRLDIEIVRRPALVKAEWIELARRSGNVFATWEWASVWWRHFGRRGEPLVAICRARDGSPVGLLPLYRVRGAPLRVLRFIGHGQADELGPVCAPEHREQLGRELDRTLALLRADLFVGEQLRGDFPCEAEQARVVSVGQSPVLRFNGHDWDGLLGTWSRNRRRQTRYLERRLARDHGHEFRLSDDPARLGSDLDLFFDLHDARWREGGSAFAGDAAFHREFAGIAAERGWLRLWFLEVAGRPVAGWLGLRYGGADSYYQAGRDPAWEDRSVGLVLLLHTIRNALEDGMGEYRFLRGGEGFKYRYANMDPGLKTVAVSGTLRGKLVVCASQSSALARGLRELRRAGV